MRTTTAAELLDAPNTGMSAVAPSLVEPARRSTTLRAGAVVLAIALALVAFAGTADAATTHTVKRGETLSSIARTYKVSGGFRAVAKANKIANPNRIRVGQRLTIPGASAKAAAKAPAKAAAPVKAASTATSTTVWDRLAKCESGGRWSINTGNGYFGGLQFSRASWQWVGGKGLPHQASKAEQIRRAEILKSRQGWGAWPACSRKLGLR